MPDQNSQLMEDAKSLIIGADGKIGALLMRRLAERNHAVLGTTRRADDHGKYFLDLEDSKTWSGLPVTPVAYFCTGVSSIEHCEQAPEQTFDLNVNRSGDLAEFLSARGTRLVLISSNRVFDGMSPRVLADVDTCPVTEYGRQKVEIENRLLALSDSVILRVSKVLFPDDDLITGWLTTLSSGGEIRAAADMFVSPVSADLIVNTLTNLAVSGGRGIYQLSAANDLSYFKVASFLAELANADPTLVKAIGREELAGRVGSRLDPETFAPRHTTLDVTRLKQEFGIEAPEAIDTLRLVLGGGMPLSG